MNPLTIHYVRLLFKYHLVLNPVNPVFILLILSNCFIYTLPLQTFQHYHSSGGCRTFWWAMRTCSSAVSILPGWAAAGRFYGRTHYYPYFTGSNCCRPDMVRAAAAHPRNSQGRSAHPAHRLKARIMHAALMALAATSRQCWLCPVLWFLYSRATARAFNGNKHTCFLNSLVSHGAGGRDR